MTLVAPAERPHARTGSDSATTVVVATHQSGPTLTRCLESVLAQVPPPADVVVVDDASTDGTPTVLAPYRGRVRLLRHAVNKGEAAAKNAGVAAARTPLVALVDADDVTLPGWLGAVSGALAARPDLDIVTSDAWLVVEGRRVRRAYSHDGATGIDFPIDGQRRAVIRHNFVLGFAAFRRDAFIDAGGFDERSAVASDWSAWARMVLCGSRVGLVAEPLAEYHVLPGSLSADRVRLLAGRVDVLTRLADHDCLTDGDRDALADSLAEHSAVLELAQARAALGAGAADARVRALRVALSRQHRPITRAKAAATVALPLSLSRRMLNRVGPQESLRTSV